MIGMNNNRNPIQGEFADKLREEIDNKVSEEDIKKMSEASKDLFGFDVFDTTKNTKEEMLGEPDCAEEQSNKVELTLLEALKMQLDDYKNRYLRALADYQNLRKRTDNEYGRGFKEGQDKIFTELLPFIDEYDRMLNYDFDYKGAKLVKKFLEETLVNNNVEEINPNVGDPFDENLHDAVTTFPTDNPEDDNCIKSVFLKGYKHNGKVIRYATVTVLKYQEQ